MELDIEDNYLSGDLWPISKMANIQRVLAYDNILGGEETDSPYSSNETALGDLETSPILQATSLKTLDISTNYYYGTIPTSIVGLSKMEELYLEDLELKGQIIPEVFTSLTKLRKLYLGENYLSSSLPEEIGSAGSLGKKCSSSRKRRYTHQLYESLYVLVNVLSLCLMQSHSGHRIIIKRKITVPLYPRV